MTDATKQELHFLNMVGALQRCYDWRLAGRALVTVYVHAVSVGIQSTTVTHFLGNNFLVLYR